MRNALTLLFTLCLLPVIAQNTPIKFIEVTGFAEKEILADYIELSVHIKESDNLKKDSDFAIREKAVLDALTKLSVAKEDIRVDNFDVYRYGYGSSSNRYTLSKTYIVRVRNMESINDFTIRLFEAGANNVAIVKRVKSDLETHKTAAVKEAVEKARNRANQIATTLGVSLGSAIQVSELAETALPSLYGNSMYSLNKLSNTGAVHRAVAETSQGNFSDELSPDADLRKMKISYRVLIQFEIK